MLNDLAKECHKMAIDKGFYDHERQITELLMLAVSELGEACEADRKGKKLKLKDGSSILFSALIYESGEKYKKIFEDIVKDTFEDEIADTFIRLLDMCAYLNIDIDKHIELKMKYNSMREKKHGKKY